MIPLMAIFEEGVGADTLSDLTTNLILAQLCEIAESIWASNMVVATAAALRRIHRAFQPSGLPVVFGPA